MFHPFLTVQAGAPRHCLSIALALLAITSNITNYYYTRPPFRCAARACADAVLPAALHCSLLCISELCLRPNPCGIECTDCTAQYTLPEMGGSIEPPEPPLATGLISKDERGFPLTQYITNGRISRGGYTFTHFKHHHRVLRLISYRMGV